MNTDTDAENGLVDMTSGREGGEGGRVPKLKVLPRKEERRHFLLITRKTERNKLQSRKQPSRPEYKIPTLEGVLGARP